MRTHVTTNLGDKAAQTKISKKQHSQNIRERRMHIIPGMPEFNKNICGDCGFHIRGENHLEGVHHNGTVPRCHRGR